MAARASDARNGALISPFTVNDTTEQLKKLFTRAKLWGVRFDHEPQWRKHLAGRAAGARARAGRTTKPSGSKPRCATTMRRSSPSPVRRACGCASALLRWTEVDWGARQISKPGKGGKLVTVPITSDDSRNPLAVAGASSRVRVHLCGASAPATAG